MVNNPLQYYTQLVYYGTKLLPDIEVVRDIVISILLEKEEDINILYLTVRNSCIEAGGEEKELNIEYELIEVAMLEEMSKQLNKDKTNNNGKR